MLLSYCALKHDGSTVTAKGDFENLYDLMDMLNTQDMVLISYRERTFTALDNLRNILEPKVKRPEIIEFCDSLSSMVGSGLSLMDSLQTLKDTIKLKRLRTALEEVIVQIARGNSLSSSFAQHPSVFPEMLIFFCSIGEETGTIPEALKNTADYLRKVDAIISQVSKAFIYPAFVTSAMGCVVVFWLFYVLPRLVSTFKEINVTLPNVTLNLVKFVAFMKGHWFGICLFLLTLVTGLIFLLRIEKVRFFFTRMALKVPVAGELLMSSILTLFFSSLSLMLRSGLTLTKSLDVLAGIFKNPFLKRVIRMVQTETSAGNSLYDSFRSTQFFDSMALKMISVGEKSGTLDQRLAYLSETYQEKTTRFVELTGKMIEPLVIVLSGGLFVFIVVSLISPLYDLMSQLGGG